jgi:hypothetical protein
MNENDNIESETNETNSLGVDVKDENKEYQGKYLLTFKLSYNHYLILPIS